MRVFAVDATKGATGETTYPLEVIAGKKSRSVAISRDGRWAIAEMRDDKGQPLAALCRLGRKGLPAQKHRCQRGWAGLR